MTDVPSSNVTPTSAYNSTSAYYNSTSTYYWSTSTYGSTVDFGSEVQPYVNFGPPSILLSLTTILLNVLVVDHYRGSTSFSLVPFLYMMIAGVDILTGSGVIYQTIAVSLFYKGVITNRALDWNAMFSNPVISVSSRTSIFYNLVLAVSRTVVIFRPFHRIKTKIIVVICVVYPILWATVVAYEMSVYYMEYSVVVYWYGALTGISLVRCQLCECDDNLCSSTLSTLLVTIPYLLPVLITMMTCVIQVISLHHHGVITTSNQRHVTITILLMSTLFVVCTSSFSIYILLFYVFIPSLSGKSYVLISVVLGTVLPLANSALNPIIIISRSVRLRRSIMGRARRVWDRLRGKEGQHDTNTNTIFMNQITVMDN